MPQEMSKAEYARYANISKGRVSQLTAHGGLLAVAVLPNGKINVSIADRLRGKSFDPSNNQSKPPPSASAPVLPAPLNPEQVRSEEEILEYRRRSAAVKAATDEINLAERKGTLVDRMKLKAVLDDRLKTLFTNLRQSKQSIADRLIGEGHVPPEARAAAMATVADELEKMIADFRRSLNAGSTDA